MKKIFLFLVLLLVVAVVALGIGLTRENDFGKSIPKSFPKDVPIVKGEVVSARSFRSDELKRGTEVIIKSELPFSKTVDFYKAEFEANQKITNKTFMDDTHSTPKQATAIGEIGVNQVVVNIQEKGGAAEVSIQVLGNSFFSLPH